MGKILEEMTLEELWDLFPIVLVEHRGAFMSQYEREYKRLLEGLKEQAGAIYRVSHIGSTAVPGLVTKAIVDILFEVNGDDQMDVVADWLQGHGWILMSRRRGENPQMSFNQGYTEQGYAEEVFHLHLRVKGDWEELYFRDYLIAYPEVARAYAELKRELLERYPSNRDAYTQQKSDFVKRVSLEAKGLFGERYCP